MKIILPPLVSPFFPPIAPPCEAGKVKSLSSPSSNPENPTVNYGGTFFPPTRYQLEELLSYTLVHDILNGSRPPRFMKPRAASSLPPLFSYALAPIRSQKFRWVSRAPLDIGLSTEWPSPISFFLFCADEGQVWNLQLPFLRKISFGGGVVINVNPTQNLERHPFFPILSALFPPDFAGAGEQVVYLFSPFPFENENLRIRGAA